jgi:transcriptional regulator with XRE-family HTH domain
MNEPAPDAALSEWLKYWLELRRVTPQELARKINRSAGYVYALIKGTPHGETGKIMRPSAETAHDIAQALGVTPEEVLRAADMLKPQESPQGYLVRRIAQIVEKFPESLQQTVLDFVESLQRRMGTPDAPSGAG